MQNVTFALSQLDLLKLDWSKKKQQNSSSVLCFVCLFGCICLQISAMRRTRGTRGFRQQEILGPRGFEVRPHTEAASVDQLHGAEWVQHLYFGGWGWTGSGPSGLESAADLWWHHWGDELNDVGVLDSPLTLKDQSAVCSVRRLCCTFFKIWSQIPRLRSPEKPNVMLHQCSVSVIAFTVSVERSL